MFSGLIQATAVVVSLRQEKEVSTLTVSSETGFEGLNIGESIAVNGACLTLTAFQGQSLTFEIMPQTLKLTNLGELKKGDKVHLERALKLDSLIDGHLVTGHIDSLGEIATIIRNNGQYGLKIKVSPEAGKYLVLRGSVAVEGVSLTVAEVEGQYFTVYLIPLTLQKTNLGQKKIGDRVNIECDILAKYTERLLQAPTKSPSRISASFLKSQGFM